jgi:hypothetical protein
MSNVTPQNNQPASDGALPVLALVLAFVFPLAGAIVGHIALNQMRDGKVVDTNRSLAKAGMILGWVFTGLTVILVALWVVALVFLSSMEYDPYM